MNFIPNQPKPHREISAKLTSSRQRTKSRPTRIEIRDKNGAAASAHLLCGTYPGDRQMCEVLHGELSLALGHAPQVSRVAKHVVQRDVRLHDHVVAFCLCVLDHAFAAVDVAHDCTLAGDKPTVITEPCAIIQTIRKIDASSQILFLIRQA